MIKYQCKPHFLEFSGFYRTCTGSPIEVDILYPLTYTWMRKKLSWQPALEHYAVTAYTLHFISLYTIAQACLQSWKVCGCSCWQPGSIRLQKLYMVRSLRHKLLW